MKICKRCNQEKDYNFFYKNKSRKDGYAYYCKSCRSKIDKEYKENNREKVNAIKLRHYYRNKQKQFESILCKTK